MAYEHPGKRFLQGNGPVVDREGVLRYVEFLRQRAGLDGTPPIDLSRIYTSFGMSAPIRADMSIPGVLANSALGIILINENDPAFRQRFTEAHELIELLFSEIPAFGTSEQGRIGPFKHETKEQLCDEGAAELLMPCASFDPLFSEGLSFTVARKVAAQFNVSLTAALVTAVRRSKLSSAVVLWRRKHKPTEIRNAISEHQLGLFNDGTSQPTDTRKLRVEWSVRSSNCPYIPKHKSVPEDSSIYVAYATAEDITAVERLQLADSTHKVLVESHPFSRDGERFVLSLMRVG